jgi:hypothetical protein
LRSAGDSSNPRIRHANHPFRRNSLLSRRFLPRSNGASVNDALLSAYLRVLSRTCGERMLTIPVRSTFAVPAEKRRNKHLQYDHEPVLQCCPSTRRTTILDTLSR